MKKVYLLLLPLFFLAPKSWSQKSILSEGNWYKIEITKDGVYKLDKATLEGFGIATENVNPNHIQLFSSPSKLLAQENAKPRNAVLQELSIKVNDTDGKFDSNDYILFYAENPDQIFYDSLNAELKHQQHPYSNENFVFMKMGQTESKKIQNHNPKSLASETVNSLTHFEFYEPEFVNILNSGREWLGEYFFSEWDFSFDVNGHIKSQPVKLTSQFVGQTFENTELSIIAAGEVLDNIPLRKIDYRWNDYYKRYNRAGEIATKSISNIQDNLDYTFSLPNDIDISSGVYLDFFELTLERAIAFYPNQHQAYLINKESVSFDLNHQADREFVWDVSNLFSPSMLPPTDSKFSFKRNSKLGKLAFFKIDNVFTPSKIEVVKNQNIAEIETPELLIIYPKYFENEVIQLANFREKHDGLKVAYTEIQSIYNEYSGGKTDPTAIRDFARVLWKKNPEKFKYLLLFGDTNYDYKGSNNLNYVKTERLIPTYEGKESLEPIYSYSSDDYFGFLEDHEGEWPEGYSLNGFWRSTSNKDHSLDVAVGRLPVKDRIEAKLLVDKLIYYSSSKNTLGAWKRKISFVADDADLNIHQRDAEAFSDQSLQNNPAIRPNKIYLDAYPQISTDLGDRSPKAKEALEKAMNDGSLIINYNGHGSEDGWTDEKLLTLDQILRWRNKDRMPILFTATCEFGRYDNPGVVSGAEVALLNPNGGPIALLTTTRPVFSSTNFKINQAFYERVFKNTSEAVRLGDVFKVTKNNSIDGEVNRNFSLLGDPSMAIAYPTLEANLLSLNRENPENYNLSSQSKVSLEGIVNDNNFNGTVNISLYDKAVKKKTIGGQNYPSMNYQSIENKLYEGKAKVVNGAFQTEFIIPKSNTDAFEKAQLYFYAVNNDSTKEAMGGYNNFFIGNSSNEPIIDTEPPLFEMFFDQEAQTLTVNVSDESGINIANNQENGNMILVLNDTLQIPLNEHYTATESYKTGQIIYQFSKLPEGNYTTYLKLADVYNNSSEEALDFTVEQETFTLTHNLLYPNPAFDIVTLQISHNKPGEDLHFEISFSDISGKIMAQEIRDCYSCEANISFGMNLEPYFPIQGKYFYKINATQISNRNNSSKGGKLYFWK
ncbi:type IX secretion system sortase PorU [uncultured Arcticibacterium sp.]|uniref:type IX secretion system sortase PorU n=1 Tax=uncultured Arcticibacterium sp. TaxID=2173042 RepID=UPI0030FBE7C8